MTKYLVMLLTLLFCASSLYAARSVQPVQSDCLMASESASENADFANGAKLCLRCHDEFSGILESPMASRINEKTFINNTFGGIGTEFMNKNCSGCHISSCMDCHQDSNSKPSVSACHKCHNGLNVGADYAGLGIREDHERYYRGQKLDTGGVNDSEYYMKMLPDVHFEAGMACGECHTMASLAAKETAKSCNNCHEYSQQVIDHQIKGHDSLTCAACHTAWSPNEFGTFYIRLRESGTKEYYRWVRQLSDEYVKSSFMRLNAPPLLAKNSGGLYAPVRPRIVYFTDVFRNKPVGRDNIMLSDRWEIFSPHTIRRETLTCEPCHNSRKKYLLETEDERYLMPEKDGLNIKSFYSSRYFSIINGEFVSEEEFTKISRKNKEYIRMFFEKLNQLEKVMDNAGEQKHTSAGRK